jgi:hypothetical protein
VSVGPNNEINYAGLFGASRTYETEVYSEGSKQNVGFTHSKLPNAHPPRRPPLDASMLVSTVRNLGMFRWLDYQGHPKPFLEYSKCEDLWRDRRSMYDHILSYIRPATVGKSAVSLCKIFQPGNLSPVC